MFSYIWPIGLVVLSNIVYHICTKSSSEMNPLASLTVTYLVGAAASAALYFLINKNTDFASELKKLNWSPVLLGIVIVGLEVGYLYAYKAGWQVSMASVVQSSFLAVALLFVGYIVYKEKITAAKIIGMVICLIGLAIINL